MTKSASHTRYFNSLLFSFIHLYHILSCLTSNLLIVQTLQHRFVETALASAGAGKAQELATKMGFGAIGDQVGTFAKSFVGDYLHTF